MSHNVKGDFVKDIDFSSLKPYRESFAARGHSRRTVDVIWSAQIKDRGQACFFILLEPQSRVYRCLSTNV